MFASFPFKTFWIPSLTTGKVLGIPFLSAHVFPAEYDIENLDELLSRLALFQGFT